MPSLRTKKLSSLWVFSVFVVFFLQAQKWRLLGIRWKLKKTLSLVAQFNSHKRSHNSISWKFQKLTRAFIISYNFSIYKQNIFVVLIILIKNCFANLDYKSSQYYIFNFIFTIFFSFKYGKWSFSKSFSWFPEQVLISFCQLQWFWLFFLNVLNKLWRTSWN